MELIRIPRIKPTLLKSINIWEETDTYNGLMIVYSINGVETIGQICVENETRPPSYATQKNKFKVD